MRILGVDYGTRKIGLALSDPSARFAFPHSVVPTTSDVVGVCEKEGIEKIVLGRPMGYKGDGREILEKIEKFKKMLEKETGLLVIYENEVLTTQQAKREGESKKIDASAAALILQSYLDKEV